jgi:uncharacterized protein
VAKSTRQYVFESMELLPEGLISFVEKRLESSIKGHWQVEVVERYRGLRPNSDGEISWDQQALLKVMEIYWNDAFRDVLGRTERSLVSELMEVRNKVSHNEKFTYDDAERALDTIRRLLVAVSASEPADKVGVMRDEVLRIKFRELARNEERKKTHKFDIAVDAVAGLLPWRDVVAPHDDVATGEFQQAEFAADLAKVHNGSAPSEYLNPTEFFGRTYLTDGLSVMLAHAAKRLSGDGGDPVVELQTNFGGGKTHSLLALYHMVGEKKAKDLPGLDQLLESENLTVPNNVNRAVLVGTSRGPQDVIKTDDGPTIRTTWGEMAWQLGGKDGYELVKDCDENGIAPGSELLEQLFKTYSPCLILIDEWVAYLRQVYKVEGLPAGTFDANLSFVQALTEAIKACPEALLVASLPASQIEVGGEGGQEALTRLKQTFSRIESSWLPATQDESYEIVRRRLFKEVPGDKAHHKDNALKQFMKLYRENTDSFPLSTDGDDYRRKLEKAYPIHPELFDQLYVTWGSIERFQRTRGVLRFMAQVIHQLWMANDPSIMIMPGSVPTSSPRVEPELSKHLAQGWRSIIAGDVDGTQSTPYLIDQAAPNLNRYSATRRVARALFMGTAPIPDGQNKGLDDKKINLGVVQPGEKPNIFGDALRRLSNQAKFLHSDLGRYWYSTAPSLNRMAAEKAGQIEEEMVLVTIDQLLAKYVNGLADRGGFDTVHCAPGSSADVMDEAGGVRAVVLGVKHIHANGREISSAVTEAKDILMQRGSAPRVYRNTLVFIAADSRSLENLTQAVRLSLAWQQIVADTDRLNLTQSDAALAKAQLAEAGSTLDTRLREAWCWLIYPSQTIAHEDVELIAGKVSAQDNVLVRATKKLVSEEAMFTELGPVRLNRDLEKFIWGEKPHLGLADLWEFHNRYVYLPRLKERNVLTKSVLGAISQAINGPFAYSERFDEATGTYEGLTIRQGMNIAVVIDSDSVIVRPNIAEENQPEPEVGDPDDGGTSPDGGQPQPDGDGTTGNGDNPAENHLPTRFQGTVMISSERPARDMHQVVEAIIEQLTTIPGALVELKLEIDAEVPGGIDKGKSRTLLENASALGFIDNSIK